MEWTRDQTVHLIECYRERTLPWDPTHVHYKHRFKRADAWRELAEILDVPRDEVEKKNEPCYTIQKGFEKNTREKIWQWS